MRYQTKDGKIFTATDKANFIQQLRADSKTDSEDETDFMVQVSFRCYQYSHANIRTDSHQNFIQDLIDNEFIYFIFCLD